MENLDSLKYPIGKFEFKEFSHEEKLQAIKEIEILPEKLELALQNLDEHQLHTPYRPEGWTVQQLVHHIADSHMNAFFRMKFAATSSGSDIIAYDENLWAKTADVINIPVNNSTTLVHALHKRIVKLLQSLSDEDCKEKYIYHPHRKRNLTIWDLMSLYSWHGKHHVAHITNLRERMGWK